jgi:hypothetical protein
METDHILNIGFKIVREEHLNGSVDYALLYDGDIPGTDAEAAQISLAKWEILLHYLDEKKLRLKSNGVNTCGFCMKYYHSECSHCPLHQHTGRLHCAFSAYESWDFADNYRDMRIYGHRVFDTIKEVADKLNADLPEFKIPELPVESNN